MKSWFLPLLTFHFSLLIFNCGLDVEDPTPPSPPVWVQKSLPEEWPERGIDAYESGGIFLEWEPSPEDVITAYKIYSTEYFEASDSLGTMALLIILDQTSGVNLKYVDFGARWGHTTYYSIVAIDGAENHSSPSDSIYFSLHRSIRNAMMIPNGQSELLSAARILEWGNFYQDEIEDYCITILTAEGELLIRQIIQPQNYVGGSEIWHIPNEIPLEANHKYNWRIDTGARYIDGLETAASESPWATFLYLGS